jgi:DNA polymerase III alpha subunit
MSDNVPLPCFSSHYSYGSSILTLEEAGKTAVGGPASIVDIAIENNMEKVILVEDRIDGFIEGYKNLSKKNIQLIFGVKLTVCADHEVKDDESLNTESKIIIFIKNSQGYNDLIKIYNRAWTENFYYSGRTSWKQLNSLWTDNLILALPYFSSFLAKNSLYINSNIIPEFPVRPIIFNELNHKIPSGLVIDNAIKSYNKDNNFIIQNTKSIYYKNYKDFKTYCVFRALHERTSFEKPNIDDLCSNKFCLEDYKKLMASI